MIRKVFPHVKVEFAAVSELNESLTVANSTAVNELNESLAPLATA